MEIWKKIINYPNYQISNIGKVKSLITNKELKPFLNEKGYLKIGLYNKNKKQKNIFIHRLVGQHFISNPLNKEQINHINHIKTDNRVINLEWVTTLENNRHKVTYKKRKISFDELDKIFEYYLVNGLKKSSIHYNFDKSTLHKLLFYMHPKY